MKYLFIHWTESNNILSAEFVKDKSMLKDPDKKGMEITLGKSSSTKW